MTQMITQGIEIINSETTEEGALYQLKEAIEAKYNLINHYTNDESSIADILQDYDSLLPTINAMILNGFNREVAKNTAKTIQQKIQTILKKYLVNYYNWYNSQSINARADQMYDYNTKTFETFCDDHNKLVDDIKTLINDANNKIQAKPLN